MWPGASTRPVVLLGDPVEHSLSPALHNAAFRALGLDLVYLACRVDHARLEVALDGLLALGAAGANVTVPHKVAAARLAGHLTPEAGGTGAVNTLVPTEQGWRGANTDVAGFLAGLGSRAASLRGERIVILGAGGAARAAAFASITALAPARVTIVARSPGSGRALIGDLRRSDASEALVLAGREAAREAVEAAALVVNATPLGMPSHAPSSPLPAGARLGPRHLVYDLVYATSPTPLLAEASAAGAQTIDGVEMLIHQAAASFRLWTDRDMPLDVARAAVERANSAAAVW